MNRRTFIIGTAAAAFGLFVAGGYLYSPSTNTTTTASSTSDGIALTRSHSPIIGPPDASVTIVEFFDPACEACSAFHPIVKRILSLFDGKVRVVLRYAAFHRPSEEAIRILEAARIQGKFEPVLERLYQTQPRWAPHGRPAENLWNVLQGIDLDVERARRDAQLPGIVAILNQEAADIKAVGVQRTPTFFVNGKPLTDFGPQQLFDLVKSEVEASAHASNGKS